MLTLVGPAITPLMAWNLAVRSAVRRLPISSFETLILRNQTWRSFLKGFHLGHPEEGAGSNSSVTLCAASSLLSCGGCFFHDWKFVR